MGKIRDERVVHIGPIELTKEFWIEYGYCLLPIERACRDILVTRDIDSHNMLVTALASMMEALNLDLTGATRPATGTEQ